MPVDDNFDFENWASTAKIDLSKSGARIEKIAEMNPPSEPEPEFDPAEALNEVLDAISEEIEEAEGVRLTLGREAIRRFAEKVWEAAEDATAEDIGQCCGCSGSNLVLNPYKERDESDE